MSYSLSMTKTTSRTLLFAAMALVAFVVIANPFGLLANQGNPPIPAASATTIEASAAELIKAKQDPKRLILSLFASNDAVLVGEQGRIKEEINFVAGLLPQLASAGVDGLGLEYLLAQDQADIDRLVTGSSFDEKLAHQLLSNRYVLWGYEEYVSLMRTVWTINSKTGEPHLRLLGLSLKPDLSPLKTNADSENPAIMRQVFSKGLPDEFMAQRIATALNPADGSVPQVKKILVLVSKGSSFTRISDHLYAEQAKKLTFSETRKMGEILYGNLKGRVANVVFHSPWPNKDSPVVLPNATYSAKMGFPASGLIDRVIAFLGDSKAPAYPFGIDLRTSTLGNIEILQTDYLDEPAPQSSASTAASPAAPRKAKLSDFGDVYVVFGPIAKLSAAQAIPNFVDDTSLKTVLNDIPPEQRDKIKAQDINDELVRRAQELTSGLTRFTVSK